ncbi:hypothetical protein [Faecousia sp.]|uniref:hypothetical protein n=1 Tax=Faecousia sp. TaxID=2952921 RepID=UPI003AF4FB49
MSERITLAQLAAISMLTERTLRSYLKRGLLAVAEDFIQRRMDTTGQLCAVLDLPVAAAELCRTVAALAAEHGVTMAFSGDAALSRVTLRGPAQDVLAALQALSVYFPGKSCRISG